MKIDKNGWLFFVCVFMTTVIACGGGGGGGEVAGGPAPVSNDRDGDGVPNDQDADPDDPSVFSVFGSPVLLSNPAGGNFSTAVAVNGSGSVIGMADTPANIYKAVIWDVDAAGAELSARMLDSLNPLNDDYSAAYGVNETGLVVGESLNGADIVPVIWQPGVDTPTALPLLPGGGSNGAAYGANSADQVVGEARNASGNLVAVFWADGTSAPMALSGLGGAVSAAYFINDAGEAAGEAENATGVKRAVIWDIAANAIIALPMLNADDAAAVALSINTAGQVAGEVQLADGSRTAVLWQPGNAGNYTAVDLGVTSAAAINNVHRIAGNDTDAAVVWDTRSTVVGTHNIVASGLVLSHAYGLNDADMVVGIHDSRAFAAVAQ